MADSVRFTETMAGWLSSAVGETHEAAASSGRATGSRASFTLTILTPDVDRMVADPDHRSPAFGLVQCPALHPLPLRVDDGHLDLFVDVAPDVLHMRYQLGLTAVDGARYRLDGYKEVVRRRWWPTVLTDTTTLFVDVTADGAPRLRGILTMGPGGVTAQGLTFRGEGAIFGLAGIVRYLAYYVRRCAGVYLGPRRAPLRRPDA